MSSAWYSPDLDRSFAEMPRPEYPRPDFQRGQAEGVDWLNLNGLWSFEFDPDDLGERDGWFHTPPLFSRTIVVPFAWEAHLAWEEGHLASNDNWFSRHAFPDGDAVDNASYRTAPRHEIGWYMTQAVVPAHWRSERIILHFGASDWETKVWINGRYAGVHQGGYEPFSFDITPFCQAGDAAVIIVRVYDPNDHRAIPGGKQIHWYARTSGIWQTVYLEPRAETHLASIRITPDIDAQNAEFLVTAAGPLHAGRVHIRVTSPNGDEFILDGDPNAGPLTAPVPNPLLWSPDTPHLYDVTVELFDGDRRRDRVRTYFGMRKVSVGCLPGTTTPYIFLNNRPIYLTGALNQSFNPWGVYTFPSDEAIQEDLRRTRAFGFNFLRLHIKIEEPRFLYWADRIGVLLMCDIPNFDSSGYGPDAQTRWEAVLRAAIARDFNHPSIFAWCCFNETWGLGGNEYKGMSDRQEWVRAMYRLARSLDPSRLVEDNSPCLYDHVETQINSWHFYINDYQKAKDHIAGVVRETWPGSGFNYCGGNRQSDAPLINSEYGGISAGAGDKDVSWCFKYLTNELRRHEKICGYIYTELQDIEWEHNGFMNYDRSVKSFGYDYRMINAPDVALLDGPPGQTLPGGSRFEIDVWTSHFSGRDVSGAVLRWRLDSVDAWGVDRFDLDSGDLAVPFTPYRVEKAHRIAVALPAGNHLCTLSVWVEDAYGAVAARNFTHVEVFDGAASDVETTAGQTVMRWNIHAPATAEWTGGTVNDGDVVIGLGTGSFEYRLETPDGLDWSAVTAFELWAELSAGREGVPQTEPEAYPSEMSVFAGGFHLADLELPDAPADGRGALSYINGVPGRYGELTRIVIDGDDLAALQSAVRDRGLVLRFETPAAAQFPHGLSLYGARAGRFPVQPCVVFRSKPTGEEP